MGVTASGLRYPEQTDRVTDGATAIHNLASDVDGKFPLDDTTAINFWAGNNRMTNGAASWTRRRRVSGLTIVSAYLALSSTTATAGQWWLENCPAPTDAANDHVLLGDVVASDGTTVSHYRVIWEKTFGASGAPLLYQDGVVAGQSAGVSAGFKLWINLTYPA